MGLESDYAVLGTDQAAQAVLNGDVATALAAQAAGNQTITTESQAVVTDLSVVATYPAGQALLTDPNPLPGGSFLLIALTPSSPPGFSVVQVPIAS